VIRRPPGAAARGCAGFKLTYSLVLAGEDSSPASGQEKKVSSRLEGRFK